MHGGKSFIILNVTDEHHANYYTDIKNRIKASIHLKIMLCFLPEKIYIASYS